jgi:RHS repeat-associated protein
VPTTFDAANRPATQNGVAGSFTADADGRVTARPNPDGTAYQRFTWDRLGRLTSVLPPTGSTPVASYTYDPLDRLHTADYGTGGRIRFRYLGTSATVVQELDDATGAVLRDIGNGWLGDHLEDWTGTGQNLRVYGANGHGDVTWTAGSSGSVSGTIRYDPYGTAASVTGTVPDFRFQGSWADDTAKLSWAVARWYAPALGAFISEDTLLGQTRDPDSRNLYAYGGGDPVGRSDPGGRAWHKVIQGETLGTIATKFKLKAATIRAGNPGGRFTDHSLLASGSTVKVGWCIWIPFHNAKQQCDFRRAHAAADVYTSDLTAFYQSLTWIVRLAMYNDAAPGATQDYQDLTGCSAEPGLCTALIYANIAAEASFAAKVHGTIGPLPAGPWDLKPILAADMGKSGGFSNWVYGDPAPESLYYDVYGYVGRAHHFPASLLVDMAQNFGGTPSRGDTLSVAIGIKLWNDYGFDVTVDDLRNSVRAAMPKYRSYDTYQVSAWIHD